MFRFEMLQHDGLDLENITFSEHDVPNGFTWNMMFQGRKIWQIFPCVDNNNLYTSEKRRQSTF
jgi:hypothetical protein